MSNVVSTITQTTKLACPEDSNGNPVPGCLGPPPHLPCEGNFSDSTKCYVCGDQGYSSCIGTNNANAAATYGGLWLYLTESCGAVQYDCSFVEQGRCPVVDFTPSQQSKIADQGLYGSVVPGNNSNPGTQQWSSVPITCTYPVTIFKTPCGVQSWIDGMNSNNPVGYDATNTTAFNQIMTDYCLRSGLPPPPNETFFCNSLPAQGSNPCPSYPGLGQPSDCSKTVSGGADGKLCQVWVGKAQAGQYGATGASNSADAAMISYCTGKTIAQYPECRCILRTQDNDVYNPIRNAGLSSLPTADQCWYSACAQQNSFTYLTPSQFLDFSVCPTYNCSADINILNNQGKIDLTKVSQNVTCLSGATGGTTGGGGGGGGTTSSNTRLIVIIVIVVAVIIVAIILFLLLRRRKPRPPPYRPY